MRAIIFLFLIVLVFFIVRFTLDRIISIRAENRRQEMADNLTNNPEKPVESIVRCAKCSIHLPQSDAYYNGKDTFCSEGHMADFHTEQAQHNDKHSDS